MNIGKVGKLKKPKFPFQVGGTFGGVSGVGMGFQSGMGFQTWGWGSRHVDGVPDMGMGFQTRGGVPDMGWGS